MQHTLHQPSGSFTDTQITVPASDAPPPPPPEHTSDVWARVSEAINLLERIAMPTCSADYKEVLGALYNYACKESEELSILRTTTGTNKLPASYWDERSKAGEWNCYIIKANDYLGSPEKLGLSANIADKPWEFAFHELHGELTLASLARSRPADSKEINAYLTDGQRGLADLFADHVNGVPICKGETPGDAVVYVTEAKEWRRYEDGVFLKVDDHEITRLVGDTLSPILQAREKKFADTVKHISENKNIPELWKEHLKENQEKLKSIRSIRSNVNSAKYARDVATLASPLLTRSAADFDTKGHLLVVGNGTLNLKTGELQPWSMDDLSTVKIKTNYNPEAQRPRWDDHVEKISCGDKDLASYLQRVAGFMLSGNIGYEAFFVFYGHGANGKGVFIDTLAAILGGYAGALDGAVVLTGQSENAKLSTMASLAGKRMAYINELPEGRAFDEGAVKALASAGKVQVRPQYSRPYEMQPTHKLLICANTKPAIRGMDKGIWRRVQLVPFNHQFDPKAPGALSRDEITANLQEEAEGILAWAVRGYFDLKAHGLGAPKAVLDGTEEYKTASDSFGAFMKEKLDEKPGAFVTIAHLFDSYKMWCDKNEEKPVEKAARLLPPKLKERGLTVEERTGKDLGKPHPSQCLVGYQFRTPSISAALPPR